MDISMNAPNCVWLKEIITRDEMYKSERRISNQDTYVHTTAFHVLTTIAIFESIYTSNCRYQFSLNKFCLKKHVKKSLMTQIKHETEAIITISEPQTLETNCNHNDLWRNYGF